VASVFWVAVPVTILPAMAALWYFLRRYEGAFEDARVFFSLVVGFFVGLVAVYLEFVVFQFHSAQFVAAAGEASAFVSFVAGNAFFEGGLLTVVLGLRRFRARKDTPYYGAALGLGFGAMWSLGFVAVNMNLAARPDYPSAAADFPGYNLVTFIAMALLPLGCILATGAMGAWVGKGSADGVLGKGWLKGALLKMPIFLAFWLFAPSMGDGSAVVLVPAVGALAYGLTFLVLAQVRILDRVVPPELKDLLRKSRRRSQRREARGEGDDTQAVPAAPPDDPIGPSILDPTAPRDRP